MQAMIACHRRGRSTHFGNDGRRLFRHFLVGGVLLGAFPALAQTRGPQSVAPVAEQLIEAVVNISTSQAVKGPQLSLIHI